MMKCHFIFSILILCMVGTYSVAASAQDFGQNDAPIEISADDNLEWLQEKKQYVANGNAEIIQAGSQINANKIIADYRENETTGKTEIWQITAIENVKLQNDGNQGEAQKAVYNFDTGLAVLSGGAPKLTTQEQIVTASETIEYNMNTGKAVATGDAKIIRATNHLSANKITGNFGQDASGKQILKTATATGNVKIKTKDETITGNKAIYNVTKNTAEIIGNVKITRGPNTLEGARAEVNLQTNISKIFGAPSQNKRVKGVFYPSSRDKKNPSNTSSSEKSSPTP